MKRYILGTIAIIFLFTSCDKKLDLLPQQSIAEEVALSNDANVKKVLNGAYDGLSNSNLYGGNVFLFSELLAANGEIRWEGTFNQPREIWLKAMLTTNSNVRDTWLNAYYTINICNNVLGAISVVNTADQNRIKGEALFIRSALFFELVKFYAKPYSAGSVTTNLGVPLILTPTRGITQASYKARSTVEQTYAQVITDLIEAEGLLPNTNGFFATKSAAAAILSRVYLQMEQYANARDAANRAITNATGKGLAPTYASAFNNTSNSIEDLFAMQISAQDGANNMHLFWSIPAFGGRDGDVSIQSSHLSQYETGDARLSLFYSGAGAMRSGKWQHQYRNLSNIRLAEMYLTRAECNFRLSTIVGATPVIDINRIRSRVNLPDYSVLTLADILKERKMELAHEGHAIHDLKRLKGSADGFSFNADKLVFPIPQREIDANNGVLVQNPSYF
jgi:starch-binding outer membrane protein, SusD/RagB family